MNTYETTLSRFPFSRDIEEEKDVYEREDSLITLNVEHDTFQSEPSVFPRRAFQLPRGRGNEEVTEI